MTDQTFAAPGRLLDVGDGHQIFVEEVGQGTPVLFLHGGPGSGCHPDQRALFDLSKHRAIFFDQRGAGRSRPSRLLSDNTTDHLIADIEQIREALAIDRWLLIGGSWGATLALAYGERHPERVAGMVLRAVFLGTRAELDWAFIDGPARFRPSLLADFLSALPPEERSDPLAAYWRRILDPDPDTHRPAIWAWHDAERALSELAPESPRANTARPASGRLPATPLFEAHYFKNECFLKPNQLLEDAGRLGGIPGIIVQGRYDLLCPPMTSEALAASWPNADVRVVESAGHAMNEPGVAEAMIAALASLSVTADL